MADGKRRSRMRDILLGGAVGAAAAVAALRRRRAPQHVAPTGLTAFEEAPCFRGATHAEPPERRSGS